MFRMLIKNGETVELFSRQRLCFQRQLCYLNDKSIPEIMNVSKYLLLLGIIVTASTGISHDEETK